MTYVVSSTPRYCKFTIKGKETEIIYVNMFIFLYLRKVLLNPNSINKGLTDLTDKSYV